MNRIIIRTLGGRGIGYGHYYRCLSLAKAIRLLDKNVYIIFIINRELENLIEDADFEFIISNNINEDYDIISGLKIDLFIFDSYLGDNEYFRNIKEKTKLMLIDDNNDIYDSSIPDIIYNGNIHAEKLGYPNIYGQLKLLGPKYLIMKEEYWNNGLDKNSDKDGILITTGGTDEYGIALNILKRVKDLDIKIKVIIGPGYTNNYIGQIEDIKEDNMELIYKPNSLKECISFAKIVITAGGSTVYEVLSQNSIPILFNTADNQDLICRELNNMGIEYLGKYPYVEYFRLKKVVEELKNKEIYRSGKTSNLVDGKGALTVAGMLIKDVLNL